MVEGGLDPTPGHETGPFGNEVLRIGSGCCPVCRPETDDFIMLLFPALGVFPVWTDCILLPPMPTAALLSVILEAKLMLLLLGTIFTLDDPITAVV